MSFTWVPFYREVAQHVLEYETRQDELVALLYEMRERNLSPILLNDRDERNQMFDLEVIDPFTFFASWNRGSKDSSRVSICQFLREKWDLQTEIPRDFDGIPTVNPQSSWFFAYSRTRESDDIATLWRIARLAFESEIHEISPDEWSRSLAVAQVGVAKLTMGLFWLAPDKFLALDANTVGYVRDAGVSIERADMDKKKLTIGRYQEILSEIHGRLGRDNLKISLDAYSAEASAEANEIYTWVPFYQEVAARVLEYENRQGELVETLRAIEAQGALTMFLTENQPNGEMTELEAMDPFTFLANFSRTGDEKALQACRLLREKWDLQMTAPVDFDARVKTSAISPWFFSSVGDGRAPDDIASLWDLAKQVVQDDELDAALFARCLRIRGVGAAKLTTGLFWLDPTRFLSVAAPVISYLEKQGVRCNRKLLEKGDFEEYHDWLEAARAFNDDFLEISHQSWVGHKEIAISDEIEDEIIAPALPEFPLNQILYGPPGTGKTYGTIERAVAIIDGVAASSHAVNKQRFDELRKLGQIEFVTFHQSFSYEEFIESLRPILDEDGDGQARYEVRAGVLKTLALRALGDGLVYNGGFEKCWDNLIQKIQRKEVSSVKYLSDFSYDVTVAKSKIIGSRQGEKDVEISKSSLSKLWEGTLHLRFIEQEDVSRCLGANWLDKDFAVAVMNEMSLEIQGRPIDEKQKFLNGDEDYAWETEDANRYVLIVDEINRGNISKILGELITLLEPDKRIGADNELRVQLPVSGESFALPPNLYLLGTMNTADKSLALLDVALRRRFDFIEMAPQSSRFPHLRARF